MGSSHSSSGSSKQQPYLSEALLNGNSGQIEAEAEDNSYIANARHSQQYSQPEPAKRDEEHVRNISKISIASVVDYLEKKPTNSASLTIFLLLNVMIGSGILNQPFVFMESGIAGGIVGFLVASSMTWAGLIILNETGVKMGVYDYSGVAYAVFGKPGEMAIDYSIVINAFGSQLGYVLVVGETLSSLLESWGCESFMCSETSVILFSVILLVSPICLLRHFGHFAWLSVFSIAAILAVMFLVIIAGPIKQHSGEIKTFDAIGTIKSLGSIIFSLSCASANFQAYTSTEEKSQTPQSWVKITGIAIFLGASMCASMGISGYLSFRQDTEGEILNNFVEPGYDFFKVMIVTHLVLYIPVNFVIMRYR